MFEWVDAFDAAVFKVSNIPVHQADSAVSSADRVANLVALKTELLTTAQSVWQAYRQSAQMRIRSGVLDR